MLENFPIDEERNRNDWDMDPTKNTWMEGEKFEQLLYEKENRNEKNIYTFNQKETANFCDVS